MTISRTGRFVFPLIGIFLVVYFLIIAKDQIIPVVLALLIFFIILMIASAFTKIPKVGKYLNRWVTILLSFLTVVLFFYALNQFVSQSIATVPEKYPYYQNQLSSLIKDWAALLRIDLPNNWNEMIQQIDLVGFSSSVGQTLISIAGNVGLILFYLIFLFFEYAVFEKKFESAFPKKAHRKSVHGMITKIGRDVATYFRLKTAISFFVGYGSYIILKIFAVDLAEFWALLIFLLNFIPNIGSIIAVMFPSIIALIQFQGSAMYGVISWQFIVIVSCLIGVQVFMGNVIEPRWLGKSLNLSPLVILISLTIWASIWGIVGAFLCVPIMVIINTILANFERTRKIAVFLSQSGDV